MQYELRKIMQCTLEFKKIKLLLYYYTINGTNNILYMQSHISQKKTIYVKEKLDCYISTIEKTYILT